MLNEIEELAQQVDNIALSKTNQIDILHPKSTPQNEVSELIKEVCHLNTGDLEGSERIQHDMNVSSWRGPINQVFSQFACSLVDEKARIWVKHTCNDEDMVDPSLHMSVFKMEVSECSLGALIDQFTFMRHASWQAKIPKMSVIFNFDRDQMKVELRNFEQGISHQFTSTFDEIRKAFIVMSEHRNEQQYFTLFIYLNAVPILSKMSNCQYQRCTCLPGATGDVIGRCSVLKLVLKKTELNTLITLLDKLTASGFNVWWASIKTNIFEQSNTFLNQQEHDNYPLPIKWLLSEGYRISDQLSTEDMKFLFQHEEKLYAALQDRLGGHIFFDIRNTVENFLQGDEKMNETSSSLKELPNYAKVPKVILTPTRLIFLPPEMIQFNRVIRKYKPNNFITVSIRDEHGRKIASSSPSSLEEPVRRIKQVLSQGIKVGGRKYEFLGCSNSQLRQHGCWMYSKDQSMPDTIEDIRKWMGDVSSIRCVAVYVSRLGQFFSSSTNTLDLSGDDYVIREIPDVERNGYCFTDGVGKISTDTANKVAKIYGSGKSHSAYQIRLGGCKGMLAVDETLPKGHVHIRPSMKKFPSEHTQLEVIDKSHPRTLYTNRQVITLLSQAGGIPDDVFLKLLEDHLHQLMDSFVSNDKACEKLDRIELDIEFRQLLRNGTNIISDPFFRSLLLVRYEEELNDLLNKARIRIPPDKGRLLMGVADESGKLHGGQVFVQYSDDISGKNFSTSIVTGRVVIAKNPCFHPGDIRTFQAVDCKELHHLVDCVVFPIQGMRPHPDEMSGSDLDGDLYWTVWHPDLVFESNHDAMEFPKAPKTLLSHEPMQSDIIGYIGEYIKNDQLGMIANAHLVQADVEQSGIFSKKCKSLAALHSVAVDFSKSGKFPDVHQDLKAKKYPDFMNKTGQEQYDSKRILGKLHRYTFNLWTALQNDLDIRKQDIYIGDETNVQIEQLAQVSDIADSYILMAQKHYESYSSKMQHLIDLYGLENECQILAGAMHKIKQNCTHKGDVHELANIMKAQVTNLRKQYKDIFEKDDGDDIVNRALAWYKVSYTDGRFKSFAWIAHNILGTIAGKNQVRNNDPVSKDEISEDVQDSKMTNLELQQVTAERFIETLKRNMPNVRSTLEHIDLAKWNIQSNTVYIKLNHHEQDKLKDDYAKLCSTIPSLQLNPSDMKFGPTSCHVRKHVIQQTMEVEGHLMTVQLYIGGTFAKLLERLISEMTNLNVFRRCMQILTDFWIVFAKRDLRDVYTVLHIADMALVSFDRQMHTVPDALYTFFKTFTVFEHLTNLTRSNPEMWRLSHETQRRFQINLMEGFQLLSIRGTHTIFMQGREGFGPRKREIIPISSNSERFLQEEKTNVANILASRSGCSVEIKQISHRKTYINVIEGFGTRQKLKQLTEEVHHFENTVGDLIKTAPISYTKQSRTVLFEGAACDSEPLWVIPYKGPTYMRRLGQRISIYKAMLPRHHPAHRMINRDSKTLSDYQFPKWKAIIDNLGHCYDHQLLGDLRIIARFVFFHFSVVHGRYRDLTVKEFEEGINTPTNKHDRGIQTSAFPAPVDRKTLHKLLLKEGFVFHGVEYSTVASVKIDDGLIRRTDPNQRQYNPVKVEVILDENLVIKRLRHQAVRWGTVEVIRKMRHVPRQKEMNSNVDVRIQLQTMRRIQNWNIDPYKFITQSTVPLLQRDQRHSEHRPRDMPLLRASPKFITQVGYIRQKKIHTYRYPARMMIQNTNNFTLHTKVDITQIYEYVMNREGVKVKEDTYTEVCIVLPTVAPLQFVDEHKILFEQLINLSLKISDFISGD